MDEDYGPGVKPFNPDRRSSERRTMPPDIRAVYVELQRYSRASGANADGIDWVAVPRSLLLAAADCVRSSWRQE